MLVNLQEILAVADKANCAVGSFNIYNLESILAVKAAVEKTHQPVIISFGEGYMNHAPIEAIAASVRALFSDTDIPIVLHLDHAKELTSIKKALACGFTSVMYDGSRLPLEENIANTKTAVSLAHAQNASVEGELGYLNNEDGTGEGSAQCTGVEDAIKYTVETNVDALAIAIGNAHGLYKSKPQLHFDRLIELHAAVKCHLVLHGSSGISTPDLQKAIALGIKKFNINTEVSTTAVQAAREYLQRHTYAEEPNLRFETVLKDARTHMTVKIIEFIQIFAGKN